ncbi:hypothetical protein [Nocardia wallacei]|uniref:hypothetical protein n=1 Tax=Nocardia wallacei TaxID=480035 RepID=UPI002457E85B|nr:hypothetical protein [Nocardia wallacei]
MSPRGRTASLPPADHTRPENLVSGGLVVHHYNKYQKVKVYDFTELPLAEPMRKSLAALFAARCGAHRWTVHETSRSQWNWLVLFAEFLSQQPNPPRDLDELTTAILKRWRAQAAGTNPAGVQSVNRLLRADPRLASGPVSDELARKLDTRRTSSTQSYTEAEFERITVAAKQSFRTALRRIDRNAAHLHRWRDGEFAAGTHDWVLGELLDLLARTGDLPRYARRNTDGSGGLRRPYRDVVRLREAPGTRWHRLLFLSGEEATSLAVLLLAEFGWNLSVLNNLEVPLASADPGTDGQPTYRIQLEKPRRGVGRYLETRNVTDTGASSPGRLITEALQATRFARALTDDLAPGANRLLIWRHPRPDVDRPDLDRNCVVGLFGLGVSKMASKLWAKKVAGIDGSPFRRGRRTVVALDRREPSQHTQDTHNRQYVLVDKRVQADAIDVIAAGAEDAADHARRAVLVAELRPTAIPGDTETATADCADYTNSPFNYFEKQCGASFLMCLGCTNAHIHPGHHARLTHLHQALANLRSVMQPREWETSWGDAHARLDDLKHTLGEGIWTQARSQVTEDDRAIITHLLTGDLDR